MEITPEFFNAGDKHNLPGSMGIRILELGDGHSLLEMKLETRHMNFLDNVHGGALTALADTAAGYGTYAALPQGADGFTTIELKCNFLRSARAGATLQSAGRRIHNGRTTQVWDADVTDKETGKTLAEFRCTNIILYPRQ